MSDLISPDFGQTLRTVAQDTKPKEMMSIQRKDGKTYVRINSSSLSLIQTCGRKSYYSLNQAWRSRVGKPPFIFGSAIHKAMEVFYAHPVRERTMPDNFEGIAELIAQGHDPEADHFLFDAVRAFVKEAEPLRMLPDTDKRSLASGVWTLGHYFKTYLNDVYVIHRDHDGPLIERDFTICVHNSADLHIDLFGRIDFALRNEASGEILIGDHKTASQLGYEFLNRIKPNHQYTGYMYGARYMLGIESENFLVNGIQVKSRPLTNRGGPPTFTRQITRRTEQDFEEFKDVVVDATRTYLRWLSTGRWPMGTVDSCAMWGGCEYHDACAAPNELRDNILNSKFTKEANDATVGD